MSLTTFEASVVAVGKKIKADLEVAGEDAAKVLGWVAKNGSTLTGLVTIADPAAGSIATLGLNLVKLASQAIADAGAEATTVSLPLTQQVIADIKALEAAIKAL